MERYLAEKKREIKEFDVKKRLIQFPEISFGLAVIGPRRAGKTFSLYNFIKG